MTSIDFYTGADDPIDDVRAKLRLVPKSADAIAAGSLSANDPNAVFGKSN